MTMRIMRVAEVRSLQRHWSETAKAPILCESLKLPNVMHSA
jgi:hypothetical protein